MAVSFVVIAVGIIYLISFALGAPGNTHILITFLRGKQVAGDFLHVKTLAMAGFLVSVVLVPIHVLGRLMNIRRAVPLSWCIFDVFMHDVCTVAAVFNACLLAIHQMLLFKKNSPTSSKYYSYISALLPWLLALLHSSIFKGIIISSSDEKTSLLIFCGKYFSGSSQAFNESLPNTTSKWAVTWSTNTYSFIMLLSFLSQATTYQILLYSAKKSLTTVNAIYHRREATQIHASRNATEHDGASYQVTFHRHRAWSAPDCFQTYKEAESSINNSFIAVCGSSSASARDITDNMQQKQERSQSEMKKFPHLPGSLADMADANGVSRSLEQSNDLMESSRRLTSKTSSSNCRSALSSKSVPIAMSSGSFDKDPRSLSTYFSFPPKLPLSATSSPSQSFISSDSVFLNSPTSEHETETSEAGKSKKVMVEAGTWCDSLPFAVLGNNNKRQSNDVGESPSTQSPQRKQTTKSNSFKSHDTEDGEQGQSLGVMETGLLQFLNSNKKSLTSSQKIQLWRISVDNSSSQALDKDEELTELCCGSLGSMRSVSQISQIQSMMNLQQNEPEAVPNTNADNQNSSPVAPIEIRVIRPSQASCKVSVANQNARMFRRKLGKVIRSNHNRHKDTVTEEPELVIKLAKYYSNPSDHLTPSADRAIRNEHPGDYIPEVDDENYEDVIEEGMDMDSISTISKYRCRSNQSHLRPVRAESRVQIPIAEEACIEQVTVLSTSVTCIVARMVLLLALFLATMVTPSFILMMHSDDLHTDFRTLLESIPFLWMAFLPYTYVYSNMKMSRAMRNGQDSEKYLS